MSRKKSNCNAYLFIASSAKGVPVSLAVDLGREEGRSCSQHRRRSGVARNELCEITLRHEVVGVIDQVAAQQSCVRKPDCLQVNTSHSAACHILVHVDTGSQGLKATLPKVRRRINVSCRKAAEQPVMHVYHLLTAGSQPNLSIYGKQLKLQHRRSATFITSMQPQLDGCAGTHSTCSSAAASDM